ncbi:hypothetical protein [Pseudoalteromonas byunsanensis]|uniref:Uncharacterized protein n=1 Tax=Pseudoalteromonas byunsanensis TaxID=327939 RepID=A0A1S1NAK4_9GAMM|nr:hypothetical protein [Pseudoalteromonas byunsanensis]OHU96570.1 hypothetical protein BIW53_04370 [Pseudoalteromonas byunsanensis]
MARTLVFKGDCNGQNFSPQLAWSHAPLGAKNFALNVYDPHAPTGCGWWHWQMVMVYIVANLQSLFYLLKSSFYQKSHL